MQAFDFSAAITGTTGAQQQRFQLPHATAPTVWMNLKLWMEKEAVLELIYIYIHAIPPKWLVIIPPPSYIHRARPKHPRTKMAVFV